MLTWLIFFFRKLGARAAEPTGFSTKLRVTNTVSTQLRCINTVSTKLKVTQTVSTPLRVR